MVITILVFTLSSFREVFCLIIIQLEERALTYIPDEPKCLLCPGLRRVVVTNRERYIYLIASIYMGGAVGKQTTGL